MKYLIFVWFLPIMNIRQNGSVRLPRHWRLQMYSLIIVEDELIARERLTHMVKWETFGFHVDAAFSDGREVLDYLKYNTPDVILTDIKMTHTSGLDVAKYVSEHSMATKVVFLSGYEEFEYAKRAIEYHVSDYLSKPISLPRLKEVFGRIFDQLKRQEQQEHLTQDRISHYQQLVNYEKQQFVTDLYYGAITNPDQIQKRIALLSGTAQNSTYILMQIALIHDEHYDSFLDSYGIDAFQNHLLQLLNSFHPAFEFYPVSWDTTNPASGLSLLGLFWEKSQYGLPFSKSSAAAISPQDLVADLKSYLSISSHITLFSRLDSLDALSHCYERIGENEPSDSLIRNLDYLQLLREQNILLASYLRENERAKGFELGHTLVHNYLRGGISFAQRQCHYTVTRLIDSIAARSLSEWNDLYWQCASPDIFMLLSPEAIVDWMHQRMLALFDFEEQQISEKAEKSIDKVMTYMRAHFTEDISLNTTADSVYLHPTYISRLIKGQTGKTFTTLITEFRIEKAVDLLASSHLHVYEIAEQIGFHNLKYFYKVFKDVTGKSPSDYRSAPIERKKRRQ